METDIQQDFQKEIIEAVNNGSDLVFISYSMLENTEEKIKFALERILEKYKKEDLITPIFSCIKELVSNSIKANAKRILIDEGIITKNDTIIEVITKLRAVLNETALLEYGLKGKREKLSTRVYLMVQNKNLIINIINNLPLSKETLNKINDRIEKSSKYDSIADFYLEHPDPAAEGMGLGLSMIVVLLNNINIDWHNFTVTTDNKEKTFAKIIVPLDN